jgi:hypothetical protein
MKKFTPYIVIIVILTLGAIVWFREEKPTTVTKEVELVNVEGVGSPEGREPISGMGSLTSLATQGKSLECQIVSEGIDTEGSIEGTYFTHKGKIRGDFMVPAPEFGGEILSSMIVDAETLYVWTTIENQIIGFKLDLATRDTAGLSKEPIPLDTLNKLDLTTYDAAMLSKEPIPLDAPVKFTCTQWEGVDGSVFIPPANVSFSDLNASLEAGMEYGIIEN